MERFGTDEVEGGKVRWNGECIQPEDGQRQTVKFVFVRGFRKIVII